MLRWSPLLLSLDHLCVFAYLLLSTFHELLYLLSDLAQTHSLEADEADVYDVEEQQARFYQVESEIDERLHDVDEELTLV